MNKLVEEYDQNGVLIQTYDSMKNAAEQLKVDCSKLRSIIRNNEVFNNRTYRVK